MQGRPKPERPILIPPLGVERRGSSDTEAFKNRDLNQAIRFIRESCGEGINVGRVVSHVGTSRSTPERRFREHTGMTPGQFRRQHTAGP